MRTKNRKTLRGYTIIPLLLAGTILLLVLFLWSRKFGQEGSPETSIQPPAQKEEKVSPWATDSAVLKLETDLNALKANSELDPEEAGLTFPLLDFGINFAEDE